MEIKTKMIALNTSNSQMKTLYENSLNLFNFGKRDKLRKKP